MTEVKWIKITTNIFDDDKIKLIEALPEKDSIIVIWFKLLVVAGKTNDNGAIYIIKDMPTTDEMLATIFNRPLNTVRMALETFENFGMIEITKHINITNWEKHQNIEGLEKIREQNRLRKQKERERKLLSSRDSSREVTQQNKNKIENKIENKNINNTQSNSNKFEEFWNAYNKKVDRTKCEKAFSKIKDDITIVIEKTKQYVKSTPDLKYRKNPLTWINGKCWNDEIETQEKTLSYDDGVFDYN